MMAWFYKIPNFDFQQLILKFFSKKQVLIKNSGQIFSIKIQFLLVADKYASPVLTKNLGLGCNSWPCSAKNLPTVQPATVFPRIVSALEYFPQQKKQFRYQIKNLILRQLRISILYNFQIQKRIVSAKTICGNTVILYIP